MPTFGVYDRFWKQYEALRPEERVAFKAARDEFIAVLKQYEAAGCVGIPRFPKKLGVKPMVKRPGIMELAWAQDGRCTWEYGTPQRSGQYHIMWRRIGSHDIYDDP